MKLQEQQFHQIEVLASAGRWQINLQTLEVYYSDNIYTIHGIKPRSLVPSPNTFNIYVHPDDKELMENAHGSLMAGRMLPLLEYRIIRSDGKQRTLRQPVEHSVDAANEDIVLGLIQDITEYQTAKHQLKISTTSC